MIFMSLSHVSAFSHSTLLQVSCFLVDTFIKALFYHLHSSFSFILCIRFCDDELFILFFFFSLKSQPTGQAHQTLIIEEFEPDVFRQLIEYIHTGQVCLQPRTLLGVMNASDYYGLEELRRACSGFVQCCITVDTVCALLSSAERYIQYKCTKSLVQKVLEFVDEHGNEVLNLGSFTLLPQHVVRLILARDELQADEFTKFQAALMWSKKFCDTNPVSFLFYPIENIFSL